MAAGLPVPTRLCLTAVREPDLSQPRSNYSISGRDEAASHELIMSGCSWKGAGEGTLGDGRATAGRVSWQGQRLRRSSEAEGRVTNVPHVVTVAAAGRDKRPAAAQPERSIPVRGSANL